MRARRSHTVVRGLPSDHRPALSGGLSAVEGAQPPSLPRRGAPRGTQAAEWESNIAQHPLQLEFWGTGAPVGHLEGERGTGALSCHLGPRLLAGEVAICPQLRGVGRAAVMEPAAGPAFHGLSLALTAVVRQPCRSSDDFRCVGLHISCVSSTLVSPVGLLVPPPRLPDM